MFVFKSNVKKLISNSIVLFSWPYTNFIKSRVVFRKKGTHCSLRPRSAFSSSSRTMVVLSACALQKYDITIRIQSRLWEAAASASPGTRQYLFISMQLVGQVVDFVRPQMSFQHHCLLRWPAVSNQ